ncbi:hypothetical protein BDC45DRAFT_538826 [Circinella umbellata]|nr:hypothetical protein BDC45DRAFT_538826 [Circinella umbellata]
MLPSLDLSNITTDGYASLVDVSSDFPTMTNAASLVEVFNDEEVRVGVDELAEGEASVLIPAYEEDRVDVAGPMNDEESPVLPPPQTARLPEEDVFSEFLVEYDDADHDCCAAARCVFLPVSSVALFSFYIFLTPSAFLLLRGSPVCVFFCVFGGTFLFFRRLQHFCCCAAARRCCAACVRASEGLVGLMSALRQFAFRETDWQDGISVDGLIGIKGEKDKLLYTPTSFLVSLGEQDEAYLEHQQIFCSRRFLFLNDNKTHLILYYFTKSVRKVIKLKTSCCHCFKLLFSSRKDFVKSSIMTSFSARWD